MDNIYRSYDEVGIKEDVSDIITNISPTKTPFQSSLRTEKLTQKRHDWQEDSLDATGANAQVEGFTATPEAMTATVLRSNYTQILAKVVQVSGSADASIAHVRAKESAYQLSKAMLAIKRDLETALVGSNATYTVGSDTVARTMATAYSMVDSSTTVAGGAAPLTEQDILTCMSDLYTSGGEASLLQIKPSDSQIVAGFAKNSSGGVTRQNLNDQRQVTNVVDVYVSPWGKVAVSLNRFSLTTAVLLYDPSYWRLLALRNWFREVLAKTGDSTQQMIVGEFSLKHMNFKASGAITGIT